MGVVDLDEVLKVWAWEKYLQTNTGFWSKIFHRKLSYKNASITLNYNHVKIREGEVHYKEEIKNNTCTKMVFESEFDNSTSGKHENKFKIKRETVSTATISLTKGYSKSCNAGLEMSLPQDLLGGGQTIDDSTGRRKQMASASFGTSVHLETEEGNTVKKSVTWKAETTISPTSDNTTTLRLVVEENSNEYSFDIKAKVRGRIIAAIHDARGKLIHTVEGNIATILQDLKVQGVPKVKDFTFDMDDLSASIPIEGTVVFKYGVSLKLKVFDESDSIETTLVQPIYPSL